VSQIEALSKNPTQGKIRKKISISSQLLRRGQARHEKTPYKFLTLGFPATVGHFFCPSQKACKNKRFD
jgi:hypothetical protein